MGGSSDSDVGDMALRAAAGTCKELMSFGLQCGTEPFFFAWAGARRKLIMALEKKVGLLIFTFFGRPGNKLKKK